MPPVRSYMKSGHATRGRNERALSGIAGPTLRAGREGVKAGRCAYNFVILRCSHCAKWTNRDVDAQQESHWLRNHVAIAPLGSLIATGMLSVIVSGSLSLASAADFAELGILVYGSIAGMADRGGYMFFWTVEQIRKRKAERQQEIDAQVRTEVQAQILALLENASSHGLSVDDLAQQIREKESNAVAA